MRGNPLIFLALLPRNAEGRHFFCTLTDTAQEVINLSNNKSKEYFKKLFIVVLLVLVVQI